MELIRAFGQLSKDDALLAGGKGASLGEMTQAGIPVPPGFVVLAGTFERFIEETDLNVEIDSILHEVKHQEIHTVENASEKIQALILDATMPADIEKEIEKYFAELNTEYVAVRSSATAEDGAENAWAGQLDSFLNTTEKDLLDKVKRCWASLFTPRAIFYRFEKGLHDTKISVAVVIQKMVNSEKSGIAFSVHPVTQDYNQLIIEAGYGLGEAIVSGQITPNSYVVEKEPRRIIDANTSNQGRGIYRIEGGGSEWREISTEDGEKQVLSNDQILELSNIILNIESHYGFPCDIEWAFEEGEFYIVQSRPITTLLAQKESLKVQETKGVDSGISKYKYFGFWPTPPLAAWYWIDWNKTKYLELFGLGTLTKGSIFSQGGHYLVEQADYSYLRDFIKKQAEDPASTFFSNFKLYADEAFTEYQTKSKGVNWDTENESELVDLLSIPISVMFFWVFGHLVSETLQEILDDFLKENKKTGFIPQMLKPSSKTAMEQYFDEIRKIRASLATKSPENSLSHARVEELLDDPEFSISLSGLLDRFIWLKSFKFSQTALTKEQIVNDILEIRDNETARDLRIDDPKLLKIVEAYNDVAYARNSAAEYFSHFSFFVANNILEKATKKLGLNLSDLLLFTPEELAKIIFSHDEAIISKIPSRANNNWLMLKSLDLNKVIVNEEVEEIESFFNDFIKDNLNTKRADENSLVGQSGSEGVATGQVKIILSQSDFHKFENGDVIVTTMTTPDFVILMKNASAIVTEIGGLLTHAAIVSRELGIPCVIGTKIATQVLKDGDIVEVDADNGVVRIIK